MNIYFCLSVRAPLAEKSRNKPHRSISRRVESGKKVAAYSPEFTVKGFYVSFTVTLLERREGRTVFFCKKKGFELSHSPEHAFTSGAIYCLKDEIFWASPYSLMPDLKTD